MIKRQLVFRQYGRINAKNIRNRINENERVRNARRRVRNVPKIGYEVTYLGTKRPKFNGVRSAWVRRVPDPSKTTSRTNFSAL